MAARARTPKYDDATIPAAAPTDPASILIRLGVIEFFCQPAAINVTKKHDGLENRPEKRRWEPS